MDVQWDEGDGHPFIIPHSCLSSLLLGKDVEDTLFQPINFDSASRYDASPTKDYKHTNSCLVPSIKPDHPSAIHEHFPLELRLPDFIDISYGPLPDLANLPDLSVSFSTSDDQPLLPKEEQGEDVWRIAADLGPIASDNKFLTWEGFSDPKYQEPTPTYISEAGPLAFDAALQVHEEQSRGHTKAGRALQSNVFLKSLFHLGLGRQSVLFPLDKARNRFRQAVEDGRMPGYSLASAQSLVQDFLELGNAVVGLQAFIDKTYAAYDAVQGLVALANATSVVLSAIENHVTYQGDAVKSLLQLQNLYERPRQIVLAVKEIVNIAGSATLKGDLANTIFIKVQGMEESHQPILEILLQILARVSRPSLEVIEIRTGLRRGLGSMESNFQTAQHERTTDQAVLSTLANTADTGESEAKKYLPSFVSEDDQILIMETRKCLSYLNAHHPEHRLLKPETFDIVPPQLDWKFEWEDIERITKAAKEYESSLLAAVEDCRDGPKVRRSGSADKHYAVPLVDQPFAWEDGDSLQYLEVSINALDAPPVSAALPDELFDIIILHLENKIHCGPTPFSLSPPLNLTPRLSFSPLLHAQHNLLASAALHAILSQHDLRTHLNLHHAFSLCASGHFTSRLTSVLFSPDLEAAERQSGVSRTGGSGGGMGLKLGSGARRDWPPASSELRLALMGILGESWQAMCNPSLAPSKSTNSQNNSHGRTYQSREANLPGNLSFSIRQLPEQEISKILDPHSISALDFLKLSYTPPLSLTPMFPANVLENYDRIFRLFLRLLRMSFVVTQLYLSTTTTSRSRLRSTRSARHHKSEPPPHLPADDDDHHLLRTRFRIEATHFITTLSSHFSSCAEASWQNFQTHLDELERRLATQYPSPSTPPAPLPSAHNNRHTVTAAATLATLTSLHASTLTCITASLLLRKRDREPATLLEGICGDILAFAESSVHGSGSDVDVVKLYACFRGGVSRFMEVCRRMGETGKGGGNGEDEGAISARELVGKLDVGGYYARVGMGWGDGVVL